MRGRKRKIFPNTFQHIFQRAVDQGVLFFSDADRLVFLTLMYVYKQKFGITILAVALMFDHFHGLVKAATKEILALFVGTMTGMYAKLFNNDTVLKVLRIGFRQMYGTDLECGKLTSEIERERKEESAKDTEVPEVPPRLDVCPRCGADAAEFVHPAFDGGAYVRCDKCRYSDQVVTWAPTDAEAAKKWNKMERNKT